MFEQRIAGMGVEQTQHRVVMRGEQRPVDFVLQGVALLREPFDLLLASGLTPQFVNSFGGFRVQGRGQEAADSIVADAKLLEAAGCFSLVIEGVPSALGTQITHTVGVPTIGIGAGADCDGQVLVLYDLLGLRPSVPRFVRRFDDQAVATVAAIDAYVAAIGDASFPAAHETYQ